MFVVLIGGVGRGGVVVSGGGVTVVFVVIIFVAVVDDVADVVVVVVVAAAAVDVVVVVILQIPSKAHVVSLSKAVDPHNMVLVCSRNDFERDCHKQNCKI